MTEGFRTIVVACRTPCIGIGGSILCGGFSWLSAEYGLTSDPQNMLDAQVVKLDGQVVWASAEPDLLWALRGAGGSFGGKCGSLTGFVALELLISQLERHFRMVANKPTISRDSFQATRLPLHSVDICWTDLSAKRYASRNRASSRSLHSALT